jgi:2-polyprenyl-6-methoxyphenol hydroxylase-like FAD-dependent oxidoreductase
MKSHFDLIILGGGPAGTAASIMLSRRGYSVALIDRTNYQAIRPGEIIRPEVKNLLVDLDVFERFLLDGHTDSYGIRSSWGNADVYENHFLFNPFGSGWHLNSNRLDSLLQDAAGEKGACVLRDSL